jgi:ADP-heptose:LPS heptosyltransferase
MKDFILSPSPLIFFSNNQPWYLIYVLRQVRKSNPASKIILFTDKHNPSYDGSIDQIIISEYDQDYQYFQTIYRHLSTNQFKFEVTCFGRWLIINRFLKENNFTSFWHIDPDVLVYEDLAEKSVLFLDFDLSISQNSPHCSFWSHKNILSDFCNFLLSQYTDVGSFEKLKIFYGDYRLKNLVGGVSDMTMLESFITHKKLRIFDTSKEYKNSVYDHALNMKQNNYLDEKCETFLGLKKIYWRSGLPFIKTFHKKDYIRLNTIHCQGKTKKFIKILSSKKPVSLLNYCIAIIYKIINSPLKLMLKQYLYKKVSFYKEVGKFCLNQLALLLISILSFFSFKSRVDSGILLVRTDNLGDMIIFLPVLQQIVNFYTNQKITLVVSEAALEFTQGLASRGIMVEKVIVVNRKSFNRNLFYKVAFLLKIRRGNFKQSLSPVFSRESIGDTIIAASRSVKRIGWDGDLSNYSELIKKLYNRAYTDFIRNNEGIINEIERNKYFFEQLYHKVWQKSSFISLPLIACDYAEAQTLLNYYKLVPKKYIILAPGAGAIYRVWPLDRVAELIDFLVSVGFQVVVCGTAKEKDLVTEISDNTKSSFIDLTGQTPIFTLGALVQQARICIGSEAAIIHMAAAVNTPTLCIMGGGHFKRFFPWRESVRQQVVFDIFAGCRYDNWDCARGLIANTPAPCIVNISVEVVKKKN